MCSATTPRWRITSFRLSQTGRALLAELGQAPIDHDARLRLEATLREIDAGFATADLPDQLGEVRAQLVAAVGQ